MRTSAASNGTLDGSLVLQNIQLTNVPVAVGTGDGAIVLPGNDLGIETIRSWAQGNIYTSSNPEGRFIQGNIDVPAIPATLLDRGGKVVGRVHPQYVNIPVSGFVSVKDHNATGDGRFAHGHLSSMFFRLTMSVLARMIHKQFNQC